MSKREIDQLYDKHRARVREVLDQYADSDPGPEPLNEPLGAGSSLVTSGSFAISTPAYLSVRISGESIRQGSIDADLFDDIIVPLQSEIRATSKPSYTTRLELISITSGSTVLHFQPRLAIVEDAVAMDDVAELAAIDESIDRVLDVHDLVEARAESSAIQSGPAGLFDGLARLTNGLSKHNAELDILWRPVRGVRRPSRLGRQGLAYARDLFERREISETIEVWGYVYSLSLPGQVILKRNVNKRNSPTFAVEISGPQPERVLSAFSLYALARIRVIRKSVIDQLGRSVPPTYTFLSIIEHQPQLPSYETDG